MNKNLSRGRQIGEALFSAAYLVFDLIAAILFFLHAQNSRVLLLFGILTLILGGGDAFHLVPRIVQAFGKDSPETEWWKDLGLLVSSITMTIFYVVLFYIWRALFPGFLYPKWVKWLIWISALVRIGLCLCPQNNWFSPQGNPGWSVLRNLPFAVLGACLAGLFLLSGNAGGYGMGKMTVAILISFACYFPVVLWAKKYPAVGMLMIPKTIAYVWMISMGLGLIGRI